MANALRQVTAN